MCKLLAAGTRFISLKIVALTSVTLFMDWCLISHPRTNKEVLMVPMWLLIIIFLSDLPPAIIAL